MNSALEGAILGRLALDYPEPVNAFDMFIAIVGRDCEPERFAESLKHLMDAGLVTLITCPESPRYLALTSPGLEYVHELLDEAFQIMSVVGHAAEA